MANNTAAPTQDPAQQILTGAAGLDDKARADAWEAFHSAKDQGELTARLKGMNLPGTVAADLWEAKKSSGGMTPPSAGTPITEKSTLSAAPPAHWWDEAQNLTQEGRIEHPFLAKVGDVENGAKQLLHTVGPEVALLGGPISEGAIPAAATTLGKVAQGGAIGGGLGYLGSGGEHPVRDTLIGAGAGAAIPLVGAGIGAAKDFLVDRPRSVLPSVEKAGSLFQRAVAPGGMAQEEERPFGEMVKTLQKYIPQYAKATPLEAGPGGATRAADMVQQAKQNLWDENVAPIVHNYSHVQAPVENAGRAALDTVGTASQATPEQARATRQFASQFGQGPWTVQKMADTITELNNDKSILSFENADAEKQSQMLLSNPALRGKIAALRELKQTLFDTVASNGGEALGANFEQARRDWGKLSEASDWIRNTKIPTKMPLVNRAMNSVRGVLSPRGVDFWLHPSQTLFDSQNPNRLLPKAFNTMAQVGGEAPEAVGRMSTVTLPNRMLPRAGEGSLTESNPTLGTQAPGGPGTMPRIITLQGEQPSAALVRIPGSSPTTHLPPSQYGQRLREFTMPRTEFEQSAQRALPPARTEDISPARSGTYRTAGVVRLGPDAKEVAAPEPEAWNSETVPGQIPRVSRSLGEAKAEERIPNVRPRTEMSERERSLQDSERLRRKNAGR